MQGALAGSVLGVSIGAFFMIGQMVYPPPKAMPPVSMLGCSLNTTTITDRFIYPKDPVHQ